MAIYSPGLVWEDEISQMENPKAGSKTKKPMYCTWATIPVNSQSEFNRLVKRVDWGRPDYMLRSWKASPQARKVPPFSPYRLFHFV